MKTRDRILHTSLLLFNEEGEPNTTTVDIANELDISPGNLYYHFKGKDVIIAELFGQYEHGLSEILNAPIDQSLSVENNWFYFYVVFEEMYNYRFLYRNLSDLLDRYPDLKRRFRRIIKLKHDATSAVWRAMSDAAMVAVPREEEEALGENVVLLLNYWLTYDHLLHDDRQPALIIHKGVYQLMTMISPYLGNHQREFYQQISDMYRELSASAAG